MCASVVTPPDRKRLSGAYHGLREGRPPTDEPGRSPDDEVLALTAEPMTSIPDAHRRLEELELLFREHGDRRGAFLVVYSRVTGEIGRAIHDGEFEDPEWTTEYLVAFADLYRQALYDYERGALEAVPDPWQVAFDTALSGDALVTQDVVLGINAHVNYDLALALDTVGIEADRERCYADHRAVNRILRQLVDEVQDLLVETYAPGIEQIDESLGRLDETLGFLTLKEGRDSAWRSAVALNSRVSIRRKLARWILRVSSTGAAYLILTPTRNGVAREKLLALEQAKSD